MRLKENADDYRYFPDPDLVPLLLPEARIERDPRRAARAARGARARASQRELGLSAVRRAPRSSRAARSPTSSRPPRARTATPKTVANWLLRDVLARAAASATPRSRRARSRPARSRRSLAPGRRGPRHARRARARSLPELLERGRRSGGAGARARPRGGLGRGRARARRRRGARRAARRRSPRPRAATTKALNFLMGQVMRRTGGKADPTRVRELLARAARAPMKWVLRARLAAARGAASRWRCVALAVLAPRLIDGRERARAPRRRREGRHRARRSATRARRSGCCRRASRSRASCSKAAPKDPPLARGAHRARAWRCCRCSRAPCSCDALVVDGAELTLARTTRAASSCRSIRPRSRSTSRGAEAPDAGDGGSGGVSVAVREVAHRGVAARAARPHGAPAGGMGRSTALDASARGRLGEDAPIDVRAGREARAARSIHARGRGSASAARSTRSSRSTTFAARAARRPYLPRGRSRSRGPRRPRAAPRRATLDALRGAARAWTSTRRRAPPRRVASTSPPAIAPRFAGRLRARRRRDPHRRRRSSTSRDVTLDVAAELAPRTRARLAAPPLRAVGLRGLAAGASRRGRRAAASRSKGSRQLEPLSRARRHRARPGERPRRRDARRPLPGASKGRATRSWATRWICASPSSPSALGLAIDSLATRAAGGR